jgi:uncharacterized protein DUF4082
MSGSHRRHNPQEPPNQQFRTRTTTPWFSRRRIVASLAIATAGAVTLGTGYVSAHPKRAHPQPALSGTAEVSLWSPGGKPAMAGDVDPKSVELGTRFSTSVAGTVTGIRFYRYADSPGPHTGTLWNNQGGRLASVTFGNETGSGWQTAALSTPVRLTPGAAYVVSYHQSPGRYADDTDYFGAGKTRVSGPLTASAGLYAYGQRSAFPTQVWRNSNYFVDVTFRPDAAAPGAPPANPAPPQQPDPPTKPAPPTTTPPTTQPDPPSSQPTVPTTPPGTPTPPQTGFPNAGNTGVPAGTNLTVVNGDVTIRTANSTLDARDIHGDLNIEAANVHVTRTVVRGHVFINSRSSSMVMEDSEVRPSAGRNYEVGNYPPVTSGNYTLRRVHVHGFQDGPRTGGGTTVIEDSLLDDLAFAAGEHPDGYQQYGPGEKSNVVLRHNTISGISGNSSDKGNSAIFWSDHPGRGSSITIENNLLSGGAFTIRINDTGSGSGVVADVHDNVVVAGSWQFGPAETNLSSRFNGTDGVKWSNNKTSDGKTINGP